MNESKEMLLAMYGTMYRIRKFEEATEKWYAAGLIPGFVHLYIGEEAVATGVCSALGKDDYITSTHRGHGHLIARGGDVKLMMAELFAKKTGYCKGKGGSMHICDLSLGIIGSNGIVGAGLPIATGVGFASKMRGNGQVCACFFGDGASNRGTFHESINMASILKLPVIFVCENNLYGISGCVRETMNISDISIRATSYGIPGIKIDGNDVLAVYHTTRAAVEHARSGGGPILIEAKTWRQCGHWQGDPDNYRNPAECKAWLEKDPIERFEDIIIKKGIASKSEIKNIQDKEIEAINSAVEFAKQSPKPDPEDLYTDVFA
ncbi:MAG: thiamine pyrophosphate-dependent dehydrogenase E1 component subunit alpha [Actinobacteria bacterium]|nr:thiamine pyrophosphate-dependent dehydrogenase E1 component subunit alpha [Actinomycetota bacterium]